MSTRSWGTASSRFPRATSALASASRRATSSVAAASADQALAVRVSGTQPALDWAAHVFAGLSRRPTFVPRFTADARLAGIDAVYTDIVQVGGEAETTRADWRFLAEGFVRDGAVDVTGQERTYGYVATAAEYQRLGAFDGAYNFIPRFEFMADTRGDRADIPFASAVRAGMRVATTEPPSRCSSRSATRTTGPFAATGSWLQSRKTLAEIADGECRLPVHRLLCRVEAEHPRCLEG